MIYFGSNPIFKFISYTALDSHEVHEGNFLYGDMLVSFFGEMKQNQNKGACFVDGIYSRNSGSWKVVYII